VAIDAGRLLRSAQISTMTTQLDLLVVEVSEGVDELTEHLTALGLDARREGRVLVVPLTDDGTYDQILTAVAELDLPLHRLEQRRHRVAELFQREAVHV
jgi:ABC-2 type transport system ATP-binding protein